MDFYSSDRSRAVEDFRCEPNLFLADFSGEGYLLFAVVDHVEAFRDDFSSVSIDTFHSTVFGNVARLMLAFNVDSRDFLRKFAKLKLRYRKGNPA